MPLVYLSVSPFNFQDFGSSLLLFLGAPFFWWGENIGMGCHSFLQEIFPTQGSNLGLPHCRQTHYRLSHQVSQMAAHSSVLAWRIPWTEEPGGLQSVGSEKARHDWVTSLTIIAVDLFLGRLPISSSFVWSYGFLLCSFICCVFLCLFILLNLPCLGSPFCKLGGHNSS